MYTTHEFHDFDEYAASVRDVDHEITLQNLVRHRWSMTHVDAGGIHIQGGRQGSGDIDLGRSRTDGYVLILPVRDAPLHSANGVGLRADSVIVFEPGCDYCLSSSTAHEWRGVFIPTTKLTTQPPDESGKCRVVRSSVGRVKRYLGLIGRIVESARDCPDVLASRAIDNPLLELRQMSSRLFRNGADPPPARRGRPPFPRDEIIRRIKHLLSSREDGPLSPRDLVRTAGVSERTLRDVFREYFGVSPGRFLRLRQLQQVRHALRAADPGDTQVTRVLMDFGVWEFGRFAGRYRETYGELPSKSLREG